MRFQSETVSANLGGCMNEQLLLFDAGDDMAETLDVSESNAEAERLRAENDELRNSMRMRDAHEALIKELNAAGARSPELLFASVQTEIQFDGDGRAANIAAIATNLKQKFPEQFGSDQPASIDAAAGRTSQNNFLTRDTLAKMTPQEIARLDWNDVRSVLAR
jgi:hypothetical protein